MRLSSSIGEKVLKTNMIIDQLLSNRNANKSLFLYRLTKGSILLKSLENMIKKMKKFMESISEEIISINNQT